MAMRSERGTLQEPTWARGAAAQGGDYRPYPPLSLRAFPASHLATLSPALLDDVVFLPPVPICSLFCVPVLTSLASPCPPHVCPAGAGNVLFGSYPYTALVHRYKIERVQLQAQESAPAEEEAARGPTGRRRGGPADSMRDQPELKQRPASGERG